MLGLCSSDAQKVEYIHTTCIAMLAWQHRHNHIPAYVHVEDGGEALVAQLGHQLHRHLQAITINDCLDVFVTLRRSWMGTMKCDLAIMTASTTFSMNGSLQVAIFIDA